jgi:hypothetical protein
MSDDVKRRESCTTCYCKDDNGFCHLEPPKLIGYEYIAIEDNECESIEVPIFSNPKVTDNDWCSHWISRAKHKNKHLYT